MVTSWGTGSLCSAGQGDVPTRPRSTAALGGRLLRPLVVVLLQLSWGDGRLVKISRGDEGKAGRALAVAMKREDSFGKYFGFRTDRR